MKFLKVMFIAITLMFVSCGCSNHSEELNIDDDSPTEGIVQESFDKTLTTPGILKILNQGKLRVSMIKTPIGGFSYYDLNGNLQGIDVELSETIAESLGVELEIQKDVKKYSDLAHRLIDDVSDLVISRYSETAQRSAYISFSEPYISTRLAMLCNKSELVLNNIENNPLMFVNSNHVNIGTLNDSSYSYFITHNIPSAELIESDDYDEIIDLVVENKTFCCICGEEQIIYNYVLKPELRLFTKNFVFSDILNHFCVGVSKSNPDLLDYVNALLDERKEFSIKDVEDNIKSVYNNK